MTDWKAYEDGSMPLAERERLFNALQTDDALRRDYEGYQAFVSTLRDQVFREPIPALSLRLHRPPMIRRPFLIAGGFAGVIAAVMFVGPALKRTPEMTRSVAFATSPEIARLETTRPTVASDWLAKRTGMNAPIIDVPNQVQIATASYGMDWAGYDFTCKDGALKLRFADHDPFASCATITIGGQVYYEANGIGWRQDGMSFMLTGSKGVPLRDYVNLMYREISRSRKQSMAPVRGTK